VPPFEAGLEHHRAGRLSEADAIYCALIAADPDHIDALHFSGVIAYQRGQHAQATALIEAAAAYRSALALAPSHATALSNLGAILNEQARPLEALALCEQAVAAKPDLAEAHNNLGNALQSLGRRADAERSFRRALELKPDMASASLNYGFSRLLHGDYASGLALLEKRFEASVSLPVHFGLRNLVTEFDAARRWRGQGAAGRGQGAAGRGQPAKGTLLIWSDQGLGDSLMTLRYLPLLKQRGFARIVVYGEPALLRLFRAVPGVDHVISKQDPVPAGEFDWHCPNMSLPLAFGTRVDTIPREVPYIRVPDDLKNQWAEKFHTVAPRCVGIAWAGTRLNPKNAVRSIRLEQFAALFGIPGLSFVSLQKGDGSEELAAARWKILDRMSECADANGAGCWNAKTRPGIRRCACSARIRRATGTRRSRASPRRYARLVARPEHATRP